MKVSSSIPHLPVTISMDDASIKSLDNVLHNIQTPYDWLDEHGVNRITSYSTGEVIDTCELRRVRGILDGLANQPYWHG